MFQALTENLSCCLVVGKACASGRWLSAADAQQAGVCRLKGLPACSKQQSACLQYSNVLIALETEAHLPTAMHSLVSCSTTGPAGLQWPVPPCLQQTKVAERLIAQESGLERDVGQNLMQMLGGQSDVLGKRRRSSAGSVDSDESALSGRWGPACLCFLLCLIRRCSCS